MKIKKSKRNKERRQRGTSIVETVIATAILLFGIVPVMGLFGVATGQNAKQGDFATRTIEYSQDKMEQLLALDFNDGAADTTVYPAQATGGQGLGGMLAPNNTVGSADPAAPVAGYVDYLDFQGNLLTSAAGNFYVRVWSISTDSTGSLKTIQVVTAAQSTGTTATSGAAPSTRLVSAKVNAH